MAKSSGSDMSSPPTLSFCAAETAALEQWTAELPLVNTQETTRLLALAATELSEIELSPQQRLELLDVIRPSLRYICTRIDRASLGKGTRDSGTASQTLQRHMCNAYRRAFDQTLVALEKDKPPSKDLLSRIGHRLISELSLTMLRSFQYYIQVPETFWSQLHSAYAELERRELEDYKLKDGEAVVRDLTIRESYLRILLLQTGKPNQLNHTELTNLYTALEEWSKHASLVDPVSDAIFTVDLTGNQPAQFSQLQPKTGALRGLRTEVITYELEAYLNSVSSTVVVPENVSNELILHAIASWGTMQPRAYNRIASETPIRLSIGLRATHYFLSGGIDFTEQISNADALLRREVNPFLEVDYEPMAAPADDDPWSQAHDLKIKMPENPNVEEPNRILLESAKQDTAQRKYDHYELVAADTSPGGYRVRWPEKMPREARVGELVSLREESDPRWCVAVVRWISRSGEHAEMGVEFLSPKAIPVAIRNIRKMGGGTEFQRALLLPGLDSIDQPATMITPKLPFAEQQKISVQRQGLQTTGMLMDLVVNTQSFNQFTFRVLDGYLESSVSPSKMSDLSAMNREDTTRGP
ncbi:MAG: hypothetical protein GKR90_17425 [Pseudomonadales bacterium]|nr:hypothetical protein [Pseudomonadales bacterium]